MSEQPCRASDRVGGPACHTAPADVEAFLDDLKPSSPAVSATVRSRHGHAILRSPTAKASASRTRTNSVINYAPFLPVAAQLFVSLSNCHVLERLERLGPLHTDPVSVSPLIKTRRGRRDNFLAIGETAVPATYSW